jgi:hypothetical protein
VGQALGLAAVRHGSAPRPSAQFDVEAVFGNRGSSSALIYRQCMWPRTVLLFVVKNPEKLSGGGDWLWVKSGKYATVAP